MRTFSCRALGGVCDYRLYGETDDEVKIRMMQHVMDAHRDLMITMSRTEMSELQEKMDEALRQSAGA